MPNLKLIIALSATALTSGCSVYSTAVNTAGPDSPVSDLRPPEGEYVLTSVRPLFCPAPETIMVMPEDNKGALEILLNNGESYSLDQPYSALRMTQSERSTFVGDQAQLTTLAGEAIAHLPPPPIYLSVYFNTDTTDLTEDSMAIVDSIYAEIAARPVPEILVIGHTDTRATQAYNLQLSQARAEAVKEDLIERGIDPEMIRMEARGESDLLINTADGVDEVRNRRVVINVR